MGEDTADPKPETPPPPPPPPLSPPLLKAGETLLAQSLESHREICKTMISTTTVSLQRLTG
jgi:hypothetical protein